MSHILTRKTLLAGICLVFLILFGAHTAVTNLDTSSDLPHQNSEIVFEPEISISADSRKILTLANNARAEEQQQPLVEMPALSAAARELLTAGLELSNELDHPSLSTQLQLALKEQQLYFESIQKVTLFGPLNEERIVYSQIQEELLDASYEHIGIATQIVEAESGELEDSQAAVVILLATKQQQPQQQPVLPTVEPVQQQSQSSHQPAREIPDDEVLQALNDYRQAHGRSVLKTDEHLCTYAEKRAQDLERNGGLDNHAGFRADFEDPENPPAAIAAYDGYTFGENLAQQHCKNMTTGEGFVAETGTALIEWCFDSSTAGHREAQLSTEYTHACVRHRAGMYVVIFGD